MARNIGVILLSSKLKGFRRSFIIIIIIIRRSSVGRQSNKRQAKWVFLLASQIKLGTTAVEEDRVTGE